tara:strand:+ start:4119 stop:4346 length:228 start_codon:yes stop_codon:yes gene_type:complete
MNLGKLKVVANNEVSGRSSKHYHHVLVQSSRGLETLVFTQRELEAVRSRASKNAEDVSSPSLVDKFVAWLSSLLG